MILYMLPGCPFCEAVEEKLSELGLTAEYLNIEDDGVSEALEARGGKRQVPYLIDESTNTEMYESDDIIAYLDATYGKKD